MWDFFFLLNFADTLPYLYGCIVAWGFNCYGAFPFFSPGCMDAAFWLKVFDVFAFCLQLSLFVVFFFFVGYVIVIIEKGDGSSLYVIGVMTC